MLEKKAFTFAMVYNSSLRSTLLPAKKVHRANGFALHGNGNGTHHIALLDGRGEVLRNIEGLFRQLCPALPRQKGLHIIRRVDHYRIRLGGIHNRQLGDGLGGIQRRGHGKGGERPIHQLGGFGQRWARVSSVLGLCSTTLT